MHGMTSDFVQFWEAGEAFLKPCVQLTVQTKKWKTVSCSDVPLPFVCLQIPPAPGKDPLKSVFVIWPIGKVF